MFIKNLDEVQAETGKMQLLALRSLVASSLSSKDGLPEARDIPEQ